MARIICGSGFCLAVWIRGRRSGVRKLSGGKGEDTAFGERFSMARAILLLIPQTLHDGGSGSAMRGILGWTLNFRWRLEKVQFATLAEISLLVGEDQLRTIGGADRSYPDALGDTGIRVGVQCVGEFHWRSKRKTRDEVVDDV